MEFEVSWDLLRYDAADLDRKEPSLVPNPPTSPHHFQHSCLWIHARLSSKPPPLSPQQSLPARVKGKNRTNITNLYLCWKKKKKKKKSNHVHHFKLARVKTRPFCSESYRKLLHRKSVHTQNLPNTDIIITKPTSVILANKAKTSPSR